MYSDSVNGCQHVLCVVRTRYIFPRIKILYPQSIWMSERRTRSIFFHIFLALFLQVFSGCTFFSRLYMDGWRDGLNRLWRDGVTILPRPAKKNATAKNNRPVPALEKKKKKHRPVPSRRKKKKKPPRPTSEKKNPAPSRLGKKQQPPRPASKKKTNAPYRREQQNTPPRGWKLETDTTACLFFSLSCCTFISYCSLVRSIF